MSSMTRHVKKANEKEKRTRTRRKRRRTKNKKKDTEEDHEDGNGEKLTVKKRWLFGCRFFHGLRRAFHGL